MRLNKLTTFNQRKATVFMDEREENFEERQRAINAIVHEIRNPLAAIKLTNQLMEEVFNSEEEYRLLLQSYIQIIGNNVAKIEGYLKEVMAYRKRDISSEPVNICDCIDKALCEAKDRLYLSSITVSKNFNGSHWVYGNEEKLVTAFLNIIINSIEAIRKKNGRIWISVYETNNTIRITFKDDGKGMEQAVVEKIFDSDFSTKDGIGIGLANVKDIMKQHKANILADSLPDVGTSINILFNSMPEEEVHKLAKQTGKSVPGDH